MRRRGLRERYSEVGEMVGMKVMLLDECSPEMRCSLEMTSYVGLPVPDRSDPRAGQNTEVSGLVIWTAPWLLRCQMLGRLPF
jgi:hypothetical protein